MFFGYNNNEWYICSDGVGLPTAKPIIIRIHKQCPAPRPGLPPPPRLILLDRNYFIMKYVKVDRLNDFFMIWIIKYSL